MCECPLRSNFKHQSNATNRASTTNCVSAANYFTRRAKERGLAQC